MERLDKDSETGEARATYHQTNFLALSDDNQHAIRELGHDNVSVYFIQLDRKGLLLPTPCRKGVSPSKLRTN